MESAARVADADRRARGSQSKDGCHWNLRSARRRDQSPTTQLLAPLVRGFFVARNTFRFARPSVVPENQIPGVLVPATKRNRRPCVSPQCKFPRCEQKFQTRDPRSTAQCEICRRQMFDNLTATSFDQGKLHSALPFLWADPLLVGHDEQDVRTV